MRGHWLHRGVPIVFALCGAIALAMPVLAADLDSEETLREQAMALAEEQAPGPALKGTVLLKVEQVPYPLFVGVDDATVPAYLIDPVTNTNIQAFTGGVVWGAAFDMPNNRILFNNGSTLYQWPVGGAVTSLGTIHDPGGASLNFTGLTYYNGMLYGVRNIANEAVYAIDPTTLVATVFIEYVDGDFDYGGLAVDPNTGVLYGTNDDTSPYGLGLFRINLDGTGTLITPYPAGETDIDGLAVSHDGFAYLVIDQPGSIYVWDFTAGAYAAPLTSPFTTSETFSGGAWIMEGGAQDPPNINVNPLSLSTTQPPDVVTQQVLSIGNTGDQALTWSILEEGGPEFVDWFDNFDSYATGSQLHGQGGWKGWFNDPSGGALTSNVQSHSAANSAAIVGASDLVHEYAGYTAGQWVYTAWQYVPTDFTGETYFILLNTYNDAGSGLNWSVEVRFNAATNLVTNDGPAGGTLPLIKGQWVELRNEIDLDLDTLSFYYNNALLFQGTWTGGMSGGGALNIGAVDLFANASSVVYYDDFSLVAPGIPDVCDLPSDVPWLSTAPSNGTTAAGGSTPVQVSFDSTGLPLGTYNANLCVTSNDPDPGPGNGTDLVVVPVELNVVPGTNPAISLVKTVGTTPGVCATTSTITVAAGTTVYYCYEVTNTGDVTLGLHTLADDVLGAIFTGLNYALTPGSSVNTVQAGLSIPYVANSTTTNTGTWTAYNAGGPSVQATDTATVTVEFLPDIDVTPTSLLSSQLTNQVVVLPLTIGNVGDALLDWEVLEAELERPENPNAQPAPEPVFDVPERVTSAADCPAFVDYPGREPERWAEFCGQGVGEPGAYDSPGSPDSTGYALDIGYISDNFVSFTLDNFPGQTVIGAQSAAFYGMDFDPAGTVLYALNDATDQLGTLDLATGAFTGLVACPPPGGATSWTGLAIDPVTGTFYGSTTVNLYTIDPATGASTLVGPFNVSSGLMIAIAVNAVGEMYGHDIFTDSIYSIDMATGAATLIGPTGYLANFAQGMDFDNEDGTLYIFLYQGSGANVYGTVDLTTGAVTPLATSNPLGEFEGATQTVAGCVPSDYPWLSVNPTAGTTPAGGTSSVDVTFDSTGIAVGTYDALLCVLSNDPDEPIVPVPVTMEVVIPVELMGISVE